jgi:hypothetical protein
MNKLCFVIEDNTIKGISFDRNDLSSYMYESNAKIQEMTVLDLARMFQTKGVQLGTDWLSINPVGYSAPIPSTSVDAWPDDGG